MKEPKFKIGDYVVAGPYGGDEFYIGMVNGIYTRAHVKSRQDIQDLVDPWKYNIWTSENGRGCNHECLEKDMKFYTLEQMRIIWNDRGTSTT